MKFKRILPVALLVASAFTSAQAQTPDSVTVGKKIEDTFGVKVKSIKFAPALDMHQLLLDNGEIAYVTKDAKHLVAGQVIEIDTKVNLTKNALDELTKFNPKEIPNAYTFTRAGKGAKPQEIWVFTDPKCPYCKRFEAELDKMEDVKVTYIPLAFQNSDKEVATVLCSKDKNAGWRKAIDGVSEPLASFTKSCMETVDKIRQFAQSKGVTGTPTILRADGSRVPGYITADEVRKFLSAAK